ncbi:NAD(P) transhydrogenase subunit alpha [Georgenia sp. SYP-B2076]|uniref:NAD(P) transhydrogenase subunit alpha n=1 Tax=Georgenia sp. SYP-B2076 TaxID=2495881 RepID=UPI000F8E55CA
MNDGVTILTLFVLAAFVGVEVVSKVSSTLHTPLMSGANAIHGIILVGAISVTAHTTSPVLVVLGTLAVLLATINLVGGFVVTDRMLEMFSRRPARGAGVPAGEPAASEPVVGAGTAGKPAVATTATGKPVADMPAAGKPVADMPAAGEPTPGAAAGEPTPGAAAREPGRRPPDRARTSAGQTPATSATGGER